MGPSPLGVVLPMANLVMARLVGKIKQHHKDSATDITALVAGGNDSIPTNGTLLLSVDGMVLAWAVARRYRIFRPSI